MKRFFLALSLAGQSLISSAQAEPETLAPLVVTSSRLADDPGRIPANITIIDAADIRNSSAATLPDLLAREAGVTVRSLYGNQAARSSIDIRGFGVSSTQNTLILLDGRRLNDIDLSLVDYAAIPIHNIARIEIIRGSGGVLYGDGAVGGVINIITRPADATPYSADLSIAGGSYGSGQADASGSWRYGPFSGRLTGSAIESDGYRKNNDLTQRNLGAELHLRTGPADFYARLGAADQDLRLPGVRTVDPGIGLNELRTDRRGTSRPNDFANETEQHASLGASLDLGPGAQLILDGGYRLRSQEAAQFSYLETDLETWSLTPRLQLTHALLGRPGKAVIGFDYYDYRYDSDRAQSPLTIATPVHRLAVDQDSLALYINNLSEVSEATSLNLGLRIQHVATDLTDAFDAGAPGAAFESKAPDLHQAHTEYMLDGGIHSELSERISLNIRAGRSVRFGTVDEFFEFTPLFARVFSPLKPQTAVHYELGLAYDDGRYSAGVTAYRMNLRNEIHFNPVTFSNDNLDPTQRIGVEVTASARLNRALSLRLNYTYMHSKFVSGPFAGNDVPVVPRHTASITGRWDINAWLGMELSWNYVGSKYFDNDQTNDFGQKIPAYDTLDLLLNGHYGGWRLDARLNNALDEEYFDYGIRSTFTPGRYNAYPLPGRSFLLSLSRHFE